MKKFKKMPTGIPFSTSKKVAIMLDKEHESVLQDIKNLLNEDRAKGFFELMECKQMYAMTREGFFLLGLEDLHESILCRINLIEIFKQLEQLFNISINLKTEDTK
jgi:phage regulator Rha-like protein